MRRIAECIANAQAEGLSLVLVTVVRRLGSTPRTAGSQMLVSSEGLVCGTIGGGIMEKMAIDAARSLMGLRMCRTERMTLVQGAKRGLDMPCGGDVDLLYVPVNCDDVCWRQVSASLLNCLDRRIPAFLALLCREDAEEFEGGVALLDKDGQLIAGSPVMTTQPFALEKGSFFANDCFVMPLQLPVRAVVFGGGHVGRATIAALANVGFACTLFENRPEFARPENAPAAQEIILGDYENVDASLSFDEGDFVIIMTHSHRFDNAILEQALRQPLAYVGLMGSRRKIAVARELMREAGISEEAIDAVHMPIGLSIQAETPEEIAISVAAECIQQRAFQQANR